MYRDPAFEFASNDGHNSNLIPEDSSSSLATKSSKLYADKSCAKITGMALMIVVMGVSGSGKTTVGQALAERLGCPFFDGDNFLPPECVAKMTAGIPLNDDDRAPWLARLHDLIHDQLARGEAGVLACSALKKLYRDRLRTGNDGIRFIYLNGDFNLIWARMRARQGHFMKASMLRSQFDTLEVPGPEEAVTVDIANSVEHITGRALSELEREGRKNDVQSKGAI